ncbi:MAG: GNAT family N-acetyltransferase [bacterium]|nr:GNAT family N-acetyltransferase [bacterium]
MIRLAKRSEYSIISAFLRQHWADNHIYTRSKPLFDWTFGLPLCEESEEYSFALAFHQGECVGILGAIPFTLNVYGETKPAYWLANWMTTRDQRSTTTGLQLLKQFDRTADQVIISFGINANVARIYRALHWQVLETTPRYLALSPHHQERIRALLAALYPDIPFTMVESMLKFFTIPSDGSKGDVSLEAPIGLSDWDAKGWRFFAPNLIGAARHSAYLKWRYLDHPHFQYHCYFLPFEGRMGLLVYRIEHFHYRPSEQAEPISERLLRVVEFLAVSKEQSIQFLQLLQQKLLEHDALGFDMWGFYGKTEQWLNEIGISCTEDFSSYVPFPSRFQPIEPTLTTIMSAFKGVEQIPSRGSDWYWTKSDSDQDRPN